MIVLRAISLIAFVIWAVPAAAQTAARQAWQRQMERHVAAHLSDSKSELAEAINILRARKVSNRIAVVAVVLDRQGKVLSQRIGKSTGQAAVDRIASKLVADASPFPSLPADFPGDTATVRVPIRFVSVPKWQDNALKHLMGQIRQTTRYRGGTGKVVVSFVVDREGHVSSTRIVKSSGDKSLDDTVLGIVRDADPFPRPYGVVINEGSPVQVPIMFREGRPIFWN